MRVEFDPLMIYGSGYDSLSGKVRGVAIKPAEPEIPKDSSAQNILLSYKQINTRAELAESLLVSGSLSINSFGLGGSAKANFVDRQKFDSSCVYILAYASVTNPPQRIADPRLKSEVWELLAGSDSNGKKDVFRRTYGDKFVVGFISGCELFSLIEIQTENEEKKRKISTEVSASIGTPIFKAIEGKGDVSFEKLLEGVKGVTSINVHHYQSGGESIAISQSLDQFKDCMEKFKTEAKSGKVQRYAAMLLDYDSILLPDGSPSLSVDINYQNYTDVMMRLQTNRLYCLDHLSKIEDTLQNPEMFEYFDETYLNDKARQLRQEVKRLSENFAEYSENPDKCDFPEFKPVQIQLPKRRPL